MAIIYCDKCKFEWEPKETEFQTIVLNEKDDVRMRFFQCPECGEEYIVDITDKELRKKISMFKKMKRKYIRMFHAKESSVKLRNYGERLEKVQTEIRAMEKTLRGRWTCAERLH